MPDEGRRERKKAQTRATISDTATRLFLERGYDAVSVKEVAEAADVAVATLFKHFSGKEALIFDEDLDREADLVAAVRDRAPGTSVTEALHALLAGRAETKRRYDPAFAQFRALIADTPALSAYAQRMWTRHEAALARAVAETTGRPEGDIACAALATIVLQAPALADGAADPEAALAEVFALLEHGWGPDFGRTG